jgi:hypothetical protein
MLSYLKMSPVSQLPLMADTLNSYSGRLPTCGTMRSGLICPLEAPALGMNVSAFGLWLTPTATDNKQRQALPASGHYIQTRSGTYRYQPNADKPTSQIRLGEMVKLVEQNHDGYLNPRWLEALMGFPNGWCDPSLDHTWRSFPSNPRALLKLNRRVGQRR